MFVAVAGYASIHNIQSISRLSAMSTSFARGSGTCEGLDRRFS